MADADPKSPTTDVDNSLGVVSEVDAERHNEHEASGVVQGHEPSALDDLVGEAIQPDATPDDNVKDATKSNTQSPVGQKNKPRQPTQAANHEATKNAATKGPLALSKDKLAKAASGKPSPLSPTVKKVCVQCGEGLFILTMCMHRLHLLALLQRQPLQARLPIRLPLLLSPNRLLHLLRP